MSVARDLHVRVACVQLMPSAADSCPTEAVPLLDSAATVANHVGVSVRAPASITHILTCLNSYVQVCAALAIPSCDGFDTVVDADYRGAQVQGSAPFCVA
jgi:hypothetical protein